MATRTEVEYPRLCKHISGGVKVKFINVATVCIGIKLLRRLSSLPYFLPFCYHNIIYIFNGISIHNTISMTLIQICGDWIIFNQSLGCYIMEGRQSMWGYLRHCLQVLSKCVTGSTTLFPNLLQSCYPYISKVFFYYLFMSFFCSRCMLKLNFAITEQ